MGIMALTKSDFKNIIREEIKFALKDVALRSDLKNLATTDSLKNLATTDSLKNLVTKEDLKTEILKSEKRTALRITKAKKDLAGRIANLGVAKEERNVVERIERRVTTLENFVYA